MTQEPLPIVETLRAEWKALQPEIVDLSCQLQFMQWRVRQGLKKADALRAVIAIYEKGE